MRARAARFSILPVLASLAFVPIRAADSLSAQQILDRTARVYAECTSYRDTGHVETRFFEDDGRTWNNDKPFATAFVRPDRFRFEYAETDLSDNLLRYVIARDDNGVRHYWDLDRVVRTDHSLHDALGTATGVSNESSENIPSLLLPQETDFYRITDMSDARRLDDQPIGEHSCYRVEGAFGRRGHQSLLLWIDPESYLIRRIEGGMEFKNFRVEETTDYDPTVNAAVPEASLAFGIAEQK